MRYQYVCSAVAKTPAGNVITLVPKKVDGTPSNAPAIQFIVDDGHHFVSGETYTVSVS
jgi:hypothetical protein